VADRPHIFGLTASPIDTKAVQRAGHVSFFFNELESNLNAKVSGTCHTSKLQTEGGGGEGEILTFEEV